MIIYWYAKQFGEGPTDIYVMNSIIIFLSSVIGILKYFITNLNITFVSYSHELLVPVCSVGKQFVPI